MAKIQDKYEVVYIVDPRKTEEETAAIIEKFKTLIEENATIDEVEALTGYDFLAVLDDSVENVIESKQNIKDWPRYYPRR